MDRGMSMPDRRKMRQTAFGCTSNTHVGRALTPSTIALCTMLMGIGLIPDASRIRLPPPADKRGGDRSHATSGGYKRPVITGERWQVISLSVAKNEWTSLALRVGNLPRSGPKLQLRVSFAGAIRPGAFPHSRHCRCRWTPTAPGTSGKRACRRRAAIAAGVVADEHGGWCGGSFGAA